MGNICNQKSNTKDAEYTVKSPVNPANINPAKKFELCLACKKTYTRNTIGGNDRDIDYCRGINASGLYEADYRFSIPICESCVKFGNQTRAKYSR